MAEKIQRWTEDQVIRAFSNFFNSNSPVSPEEAEATLRGHLRKLGAGPYGSAEIGDVVIRMVPPKCIAKLSGAVIDWLEKNAQPIIDAEYQSIQ